LNLFLVSAVEKVQEFVARDAASVIRLVVE